jgi:large subunit ribosomal protein L16
VHKIALRKTTTRGHYLSFGVYGLKAVSSNWITSAQIESARKAIARAVQRGGKIWIRIFPDKPRTQKGAETGMGGGAGSLSHFVAPVEAGRILFEMDGVSEIIAKEAFRKAGNKLPVRTKFVSK